MNNEFLPQELRQALQAFADAVPLPQVLLTLAAVIVVGRILGRLLARVGQPPVIGEIVAGILLGPSLLGWVAPEWFAALVPAGVTSVLGLIAQAGVILYMFLVGLELDADTVGRHARTTIVVSLTGIVVPFALGIPLAFYLHPRFSIPGLPLISFALFIGVAMSITAFPVLARIVADRGLTRSELGTLALAAAAIGDVAAWCLLAGVVGVVRSDAGGAGIVVLLTLAFIATTIFVVRPAVRSLPRATDEGGPGWSAVIFTFLLMVASAATTSAIGVHALFGAFLFGAVIPHDSALARVFRRRLEPVVLFALLPAFFAFSGLRTNIALLYGVRDWTIALLIILVATAGKFGGTFIAARLSGLGARPAACLGVLMNTRGLMELIVLNIGLELGVISPTVYTMFVIMALVTTLATSPLLKRLMEGRSS